LILKDFLPNNFCSGAGAVLNVGKKQICQPGHTHSVRHVEGSLKRRVYLEYGIAKNRPDKYDIDHLFSLELAAATTSRIFGRSLSKRSPGRRMSKTGSKTVCTQWSATARLI